MALIELEQVSREYRMGEERVCALRNVSLRVEQGEFVSIVGRSGSGKSTLMNLIGCLDRPTAGQYRLAGQPMERLGEREISRIRNRTVGFVFQGFHLVPGLTALENVELPLVYRGWPAARRRRTAEAALARLGLAERANHRPAQMSGGQQQRVAVARAVAADLPLILADEPTGNLDGESGAVVMDMLETLWYEGKTVLLITHDPLVAIRAPRRVMIDGGTIAGEEGFPKSFCKKIG